MNRRPTRHAFTLIELLLVMVIIAVLAAVVVPKFVGRSQDARITAAKADISSMELALDAFEVDIGRYPSTEEGLEALITAPNGVTGWKGPYLKKGVPNDPWGNAYNYKSPGTHDPSYDLYSFGPDGREGGGDDIISWKESK